MSQSQQVHFDKGFNSTITPGLYSLGFVGSCVATYLSVGALSNVNIAMGSLLWNEISLMSGLTGMVTNGIGAYGEIAGKTEETDKVQHSFIGLLTGSVIDASMGKTNQEATNVIDIGYSIIDVRFTSKISSPFKYLILGSDVNTIFNSGKNLKNIKAADTINELDENTRTEILPSNPEISPQR
ncbi:MAG: hypothetical protein A2X64_10865 [Ignavibacteria bacterium GWF2_33_9]|nr:MAG: hypothetical protein A2X64_10865 [Ignavibacteria bacterium GWF2_33_9]